MKNPKRSLLFIFLTILIDCIGLGIIIPTLPTLLQQLSGEDVSGAANYGGWLAFSYAIMSFLFSPVLGGLSDTYGRRPILLLSLLGLGLDYFFLALAPSIMWLFVGRIISGICGASFTTAFAYIADVSSNEDKAKNFGMVGAAFGLGFIVGPLLGSLFGTMGTRAPFYAAGIFSLLNFLFGYFVLPESLTHEHRRPFDWKRANPFGSLRHLSRQKTVIALITSFFILQVAGQAMPAVWSFFCIEKFKWNEQWIGYSLAMVGISIALVQGVLIGTVTKKLGSKKSIFVGLAFYMLGFFLFAFASKSWMMFAFMIPYALGGISVPNIQSILTTKVPANEQGELQGGLTSLVSIAAIIGPVLMAGSFSHFTQKGNEIYFPGISFFIGGLLTMVSLIISYSALKRLKASEQPVVAEPLEVQA
jgi:DHA1 family tetracycline resistance protein-like MFS transporter